ncbi:MAG: serine/threonine protein kinase [Phycisphaerales bacterium]
MFTPALSIDFDHPAVWVFLGVVVGLPVAIALIIYLVMPICRAVAWIIGQVARFIIAMLGDAVRLIGIAITSVVFAPLAAVNVLLGRWSAAQHYGRAIGAEGRALASCLYRLAIGHPARLFGLKALVEGIEQRVPQAVAAAPPPTAAPARHTYEPDPPAIIDQVRAASKSAIARSGNFDGYRVIGTLAGGGSGGKLYIAQPDPRKLAALARQGFQNVGDVVIKSFSVATGSSLPQIVRESRALEAARKLGLVLEHDLTPERFFYVMRYVPGDSLAAVAQRLHTRAGPAGLRAADLREVLTYTADLLATLSTYHRAGLWHKDVKPDNIIVAEGRAHLVDFGLITPLRSSMTLTTHGTEYFRDPEMVRLALKGVKVHEVDGCKFDVYAAGAVLYSAMENSFPAHGGLSQISRPCPEAVRWIVRRAMTDYDKRYATADDMLADLRAVIAVAADPAGAEALRPIDLPSMRGSGESPAVALQTPAMPPPLPFDAPVAVHVAATPRPVARSARPAVEQLKSARARAVAARQRVHERMSRLPRASRGVHGGVYFALAGTAALVVAVLMGFTVFAKALREGVTVDPPAPVASVRLDRADGQPIAATPAPTRARTSGTRTGSRNTATSPLPADGNGAQVLLVSDAPGSPLLTSAVDRARASGFALSGIGVETDPAGSTIETSASLRNSVGILPIPGDEARKAIARWFEKNPTVSAVVWVRRAEESETPFMSWVVASDDLPAPVALRLAEAFRIRE